MEAVEDLLDVGGGDPHAGVLDGDLRPSLRRGEDDLHRAAGAVELHRVVHEVDDDLLQPATVGLDDELFRTLDRHRETEPLVTRRELGGDVAAERGDVERPLVELRRAGLDQREVGEILDQPRHPLGVALDRAEEPLARLGRPLRVLEQRQRGGLDRRQRRAQLVRDVGHELLPQPLQPLEAGDVEEDHHDPGALVLLRRQPRGVDLVDAVLARIGDPLVDFPLAAERRVHRGEHRRAPQHLHQRPAGRVPLQAEDAAERLVDEPDLPVVVHEEQPFLHPGDDRGERAPLHFDFVDLAREGAPHPLRGPPHVADLVLPRRGDRQVELPRGDPCRGGRELLDRPRPAAHDAVGEQRQRERRADDEQRDQPEVRRLGAVHFPRRQGDPHEGQVARAVEAPREVVVALAGAVGAAVGLAPALGPRLHHLRPVEVVRETSEPLVGGGGVADDAPVAVDQRNAHVEARPPVAGQRGVVGARAGRSGEPREEVGLGAQALDVPAVHGGGDHRRHAGADEQSGRGGRAGHQQQQLAADLQRSALLVIRPAACRRGSGA